MEPQNLKKWQNITHKVVSLLKSLADMDYLKKCQGYWHQEPTWHKPAIIRVIIIQLKGTSEDVKLSLNVF